MKFMANIWALLVLIVMCSVGLPAAAHTATDTVACMKDGLAAKPFSGSYAARLKQARHLPAGTVQVLVNDTWKPLPAGGSLWQLCQGPTLQEQLDTANATIQELTDTKGKLTEKVGKLTEELGATDRKLGNANEANTALQHELQNLKRVSNLQWVVLILLLALFMMACYRQHLDEFWENLHQRSLRKDTKRPADFGSPPAKDQGDATAPDAGPGHAGQH